MKKTRGKRRRLNECKDSEEILSSSTKQQELPNFQGLTTEVENSSKEMMDALNNLYVNIVDAFKMQSNLTRECIINCTAVHKSTNVTKELLQRYIEINNEFTATFTQLISDSISKALANIHQDKNEEKVTSINDDVLKVKLKERRSHYVKYHRAKTIYKIYSKELEKENPEMPRKFRPVEIENEPEEELNIREQLAKEKFKHETMLLQARSQRFEKNVQDIDDDVHIMINDLPKEEANELLIKWKNHCKKDSEKSEFIFKKREKWIINNFTGNLRKKQTNSRSKNEQQSSHRNRARWDHKRKRTRKKYQSQFKDPNTEGRHLEFENSMSPTETA